MSLAVRRSLTGGVLAVVVTLSGCGGSSPEETPDSSADASVSSSSAEPTLPPPSGPGCEAVGDIAPFSEMDLIEALHAIPSTQTFATYLAEDESAAGKYGMLDGVTAFVPVDSAWTKLDEASVEDLEDPDRRIHAVQYALVPIEVAPDELAGAELPTFRAPDVVLTGAASGNGIMLNGSAKVLCSAIPFDGGLIYLTDTLLLPPN